MQEVANAILLGAEVYAITTHKNKKSVGIF